MGKLKTPVLIGAGALLLVFLLFLIPNRDVLGQTQPWTFLFMDFNASLGLMIVLSMLAVSLLLLLLSARTIDRLLRAQRTIVKKLDSPDGHERSEALHSATTEAVAHRMDESTARILERISHLEERLTARETGINGGHPVRPNDHPQPARIS